MVTDESGLVAALDVLMHALRLAFVRLDLTMPGMTPLSVSRGTSQQPDRVMPLYAGEVHVGQLSLAVRPGLEPLGRADERLLDALGHVLASSAYNLGLQQALRRALAETVTAREEERRFIRREIHDGIGPLLAAALLRTETAMDLPPGCPSQAESLQKLHELQKTALIDVRSLVEGLRPPALDHGGLLSALQQHAELSAGMTVPNSPAVSFEVVGDISILPAAVEVAAYRIAQEAISNATKHAFAQRITVRIEPHRQRSHRRNRRRRHRRRGRYQTIGHGFGIDDRTSYRAGRLVYQSTVTNRRHVDQGLAADLDRRLGRKHMTGSSIALSLSGPAD